MSAFRSQTQEDFLTFARERGERNQTIFEGASTPTVARNLALYSQLYPHNTSTLGVALVASGIPATDPLVAGVAQTELRNRDTLGPIDKPGEGWFDLLSRGVGEFIIDPLKGTMRWGMMALMAPYEMTIGGFGVRVAGGGSVSEQQPFLGMAAGDVFGNIGDTLQSLWEEATTADSLQGEMLRSGDLKYTSNQGSGWLLGSEVDPEVQAQVNTRMADLERTTAGLSPNEQYRRRLEGAPEIWRQSATTALQTGLGAPMTQQGYADREGVLFQVPNMRAGQSFYTPYSPGRFAAATVFQPGTTEFAVASGIGDFASQVFLDPINYVGLSWAKAGIKGRTVAGKQAALIRKLREFNQSDALVSDVATRRLMNMRGEYVQGPLLSEVSTFQTGIPGAVGQVPFTNESLDVFSRLKPASRVVGPFADESAQLLDTLKLQVGAERIVVPGARPLAAGPTSPPQWVLDTHIGELRKTIEMHQVQAGLYVVGDTTSNVVRTIEKTGRKWQIFDETGEAIGDTHTSLRNAQEAATRELTGRVEDPMIAGTPISEFVERYDDLWVDDNGLLIDMTSAQGKHSMDVDEPFKALDGPRFHRTSAVEPGGGNARVRVFGKTIDVDGPIEDLPEEAVKILRKANKLDKNGYKGFGDPLLDKLPDELFEWMRTNGYGKIKIGDRYLVLDDYIGGAKGDPMNRQWFQYGDRPIQNTPVGDAVGNTPDAINRHLDELKELSTVAIDATDPQDAARRIAAFRESRPYLVSDTDELTSLSANLDSSLPGVRSSVDLPLFMTELNGRHATAFINEIAKAAEKGPAHVDRILNYFDSRGIPISLATRRKIIGAKSDPEAVKRAVADWVATGPGSLVLPGMGRGFSTSKLTGTGILSRVTDKPAVARRLSAMLPTTGVNLVENPDHAYSVLNRILPNYNIHRGTDAAGTALEYTDRAGKIHKTRSIEDVMADMRRLEANGDKTQAYKVLADYSEYLFAHTMRDTGGDPTLVEEVTKFWRDIGAMHSYDVGRAGITGLSYGVGDSAKLFDTPIIFAGPHTLGQAWSGAVSMPNQKLVKRVLNETDLLGRIANQFTTKVINTSVDTPKARRALRRVAESGGSEINALPTVAVVDRAGFLFATSMMNKVWKPLVLLRGAWTFRIMLDDQMRMAGAGYDSMFNHPFQLIGYALSRDGAWRKNFAKGFVDVNGVRFDKADISALMHGEMYKAALMRLPDQAMGPMAFGHRHWVNVKQGDPATAAKYNDGLATMLNGYGADVVMRKLATSKAKNKVRAVKGWLKSDAGLRTRMGYANLHSKDADLSRKILEGDDFVIEKLVEQQYASLHHATGGVVLEDDAHEAWRLFEDRNQIYTHEELQNPKLRPGEEAKLVVHIEGDADLLAVIGKGYEAGPLKTPLRKNAKLGEDGEYESILSSDGYAEFRTLIGRKVKERGGTRFPSKISAENAEKANYTETMGEMGNRVVHNFYGFFMGKPSNWLSRSPLFKQAYWRSMGNRLPFVDDALRTEILKRAKQAGVEKDVLRAEKAVRGTGLVDEVTGQITNLDQLDEYAKAEGLAQVHEVLFDLVDKKNISDSLNLIFPFAEAWGEFITRWSKILATGDRNLHNVNRFRQGINGVRQSDPFDVMGQEGFFHENDYGQEVFSYPAFLTKGQMMVHNVLNNIPVANRMLGPDVDPSYADRIDVTGTVSSLNFASTIIPGFGPVFQMAARGVLSDDPSWDWVKDIIAPFGTSGGVINQFSPAWLKRMLSAHGNDDTALQATYMATVQDVLRTMMDNGEFAGFSTAEEFNAKAAEAEERAKGLLMVRAASTWWMPVSPQYQFQKEDVDGMVWSYTNLGNAYREILYGDAQSDKGVAFNLFYERYGFLPTAFSAPSTRTYTIKPRATSTEGGVFERNYPELFSRYPGTAMFIDPTIGTEQTYDHGRVVAQLETSHREHWTAEQMVVLADDQLGDIWWEEANRKVSELKGEVRDAALAEERALIAAAHPLWRQPIPGKRAGVTNEQQMAEVDRWLVDPDVSRMPVAQGARQYMNLRQQILDTHLETLGVTTISGSTSEEAQFARKMLREFAAAIEERIPEFGPLWRNVYASEVSPTHDGYERAEFDLYGGNIFAETLGA